MKENYTKYLFYLLIFILLIINLRQIYGGQANIVEPLSDINYYSHFNELDKKFRKCGYSAEECKQFYLQHNLPFSSLMIIQFQFDLISTRSSHVQTFPFVWYLARSLKFFQCFKYFLELLISPS